MIGMVTYWSHQGQHNAFRFPVNSTHLSPWPQFPFDPGCLPTGAIDHPPSTSFVGMVNCCGFYTINQGMAAWRGREEKRVKERES